MDSLQKAQRAISELIADKSITGVFIDASFLSHVGSVLSEASDTMRDELNQPSN